MISYKKMKAAMLQDPATRKAYDALGPEYELIALIIQKRLDEGLTQSELARRIGTKQSAIARFEAGGSNPTIDFLHRLAEALDSKLVLSLT